MDYSSHNVATPNEPNSTCHLAGDPRRNTQGCFVADILLRDGTVALSSLKAKPDMPTHFDAMKLRDIGYLNTTYTLCQVLALRTIKQRRSIAPAYN